MPRFSRVIQVSIVGFVIALTAGCNETSLPTAPPPPVTPPAPPAAPGSGEIFGIVTSTRDGRCLVGATIEILDGPRAGERSQQSKDDCESIFDYSVYAFIFKDLPADTTVTLRASMAGYESRTMNLSVTPGCCFHHHASSVNFALPPLP